MKFRGFLVLALLSSPVLVFLFLHKYGENRFDVEVFYLDSLDHPCQPDQSAPYRPGVDLIREHPDSLILIGFLDDGAEQEVQLQRARICEKISGTPVVYLLYSQRKGNFSLSCENITFPEIQESDSLQNCVFLLPENANLVLLDGRGTVRGYYSYSVGEEIDRLAMEIDILFKNDEHQSGEI